MRFFETDIFIEEYFETHVQRMCDDKSNNLAADLNVEWETYRCHNSKSQGKCCIWQNCPHLGED